MADSVDVVMPQMGVSVSEGTISRWLKAVGETVQADETIVEISTDKVDTEVPAPATGTVTELLIAEGETVDVGTPIARIAVGGGAPAAEPAAAAPAAPAAAAPAEAAPEPAATAVAEAPAAVEPAASVVAEPAGNGDGPGRAFVSPVVARMVAEHGLDIDRIPGTGRGGRVTKRDVEAVLQGGAAPASAPAAAPAPAAPAAPAPAPAAPAPVAAAPVAAAAPAAPDLGGLEELFKFPTIRKAISHRMRESLSTAAQVTSIFEVDMSRVAGIRAALNKGQAQQLGVKYSFLPFIMRATVDAIRQWPWVNAEMRGMEEAVIKRYVNLGLAVAVDDGKGLMVPVIKNAEERNLTGLQRSIVDLAEKARTKKLSPDEMSGATFSISNYGSAGTLIGGPIIPVGTVAILGVGTLQKRPVVVTDETGADAIAIRQMMYLSLSYDHRLVDGAYGGSFMSQLKKNLESWDAGSYGA